MTVVDTDVLIDALRGREPSRSRVAEGLKAGTLATTAITAFELRSGARTTKQEEEIEDLLAPLSVLAFDEVRPVPPRPPAGSSKAAERRSAWATT